MFEIKKIAVIGQGYVGLPLAVELGKKFLTIGFDINQKRINELSLLNDTTLEVTSKELSESKKLLHSSKIEDISDANIYIVTVPTPIDDSNVPELGPLQNASKMIGSVINRNDIVIFESTVYPGATEEICIPIIENISQLKFNVDFYVQEIRFW